MGNVLDERVEYAIKQLWLAPLDGDGAEAKKKLEEAVADGNGDACFFLARCYFGESFISPRFGFEENDEKGEDLINRSIEAGSAIGMLGAKRLGGFQPRCGSLVHSPYNSWGEIWEAVNKYADKGQAFCQYLVGNALYYGDCIEILGIPEDKVDLPLLQKFQNQAIHYLEGCVEQGLYMAVGNLIDIYISGDYGMPVNEKRAKELEKAGADMGIGFYEIKVGKELKETAPEQAMQYFERAISHGESGGYVQIALMYMYDGAFPMDLRKAVSLLMEGFEKDPDNTGLTNNLGYIYYRGGEGIEQDYVKAVKYFEMSIKRNDWCSDMLGTCYLNGFGTSKDYVKAKELFLKYPGEELSAVGLGKIYCYGLGTKQDIKKGMEYLDKFPENKEGQEIKSHFKKSLFGWKQID